jgi:hypothetical protein
MTIFNSLFSTAFLILFATSVAVGGSMILLALFDLAIGKRSKPSIAADADGELPHADPTAGRRGISREEAKET